MKPNKLKVEFICGCTFDCAGNLINNEDLKVARDFAASKLLQIFGGYSESVVNGAWRSPASGKTAHDTSIVYRVLIPSEVSEETLDCIQADLVAAFNQESVPYVVTPVFCKF